MIEATGVNITSISTINDPNYPQGCILSPKVSNHYNAIFNTASSKSPCGNSSKVALKGSAKLSPKGNFFLNLTFELTLHYTLMRFV